jgi:hypothetical protein
MGLELPPVDLAINMDARLLGRVARPRLRPGGQDPRKRQEDRRCAPRSHA